MVRRAYHTRDFLHPSRSFLVYFQLKKLILWPRKSGLPPRVVEFQLGAVNVISGFSKTGKSAIIPILDYCLGADKCAIPVKTIRDASSWFGAVFDTVQGEILLARREPGGQKSTGDMFVIQASTAKIPERIEKPNSTIESVKATLNDLAGLTGLEFDSGTGIKGRPSFRDMVAFVFQPQNIVANPNVLFYKAETTEHREKLKMILPYVLGAVDADVLALDQDLQKARLELRRKERELDVIRQVSLRWVSDLKGKASRAHELGLLAATPSETATVEDLVAQLRVAALSGRASDADAPAISSTRINLAAEELVALQAEETAISSSLSHLKQRVADMMRFRNATTEYKGSLSIRRDRLQVSDWVGDLFSSEHECPLCGTQEPPIRVEVTELQNALRRVEDQANDIAQVPVAFDREFQRLRDDLDRQAESLNAIRVRKRVLQSNSTEIRDRQYLLTEGARFAGGLEEALTRYDQISNDGELSSEVNTLRDHVSAMEAELQRANINSSLARAGQRFSGLISRILPRLDVERPDDPVQLVLSDLTLRIAGDNRDDYLWEIGSGANWLSYHIAASVALHQLFQSLHLSPVPSFAVYDQPSQVYFPRYTDEETVEGGAPSGASGSLGSLRDEDVTAVRQVFQVLSQAASDSNGRWQAVVLDHAAANVWGTVKGVHLVEEWRGGNKLIPDSWLT
jgi:hypothetical protein